MPGWDCATPKGRTTIVFGIWPMRLARTLQVLAMTTPISLLESEGGYATLHHVVMRLTSSAEAIWVGITVGEEWN
jgi:hypothetical protein